VTNTELLDVLRIIYGDTSPWPKPLHLFSGRLLVENGYSIRSAAKEVSTTNKALEKVVRANDPVSEVFGITVTAINEVHILQATRMLGQLLLGRCAEMVFESIFKREMPTTELELKDLREGRTDTDYRLYNTGNRPVYRVNIKFHGSRFRRAPELVDLDPNDCFALATYKIHSALLKQEEEGLPYFFAVVGVAHLTGESVGSDIPRELLEATAFVSQAPRARGKRDFEDAIVERLVVNNADVFQETLTKIEAAEWYILSARKADKLLREKLFDRVFALRIRGFAKVFRGAELDMHFSLSEDMTPLPKFIEFVKAEGLHKVTTFLERGEF